MESIGRKKNGKEKEGFEKGRKVRKDREKTGGKKRKENERFEKGRK